MDITQFWMSIWVVKLHFVHRYNVLQSPGTSAVVTLLQKHGAASAMLNWAGLQLFGIARMVQGHKLTTGIRYRNFPFPQCSKTIIILFVFAYRCLISWSSLKKSFMKKLHRPSWGPFSYCAKPSVMQLAALVSFWHLKHRAKYESRVRLNPFQESSSILMCCIQNWRERVV